MSILHTVTVYSGQKVGTGCHLNLLTVKIWLRAHRISFAVTVC